MLESIYLTSKVRKHASMLHDKEKRQETVHLNSGKACLVYGTKLLQKTILPFLDENIIMHHKNTLIHKTLKIKNASYHLLAHNICLQSLFLSILRSGEVAGQAIRKNNEIVLLLNIHCTPLVQQGESNISYVPINQRPYLLKSGQYSTGHGQNRF